MNIPPGKKLLTSRPSQPAIPLVSVGDMFDDDIRETRAQQLFGLGFFLSAEAARAFLLRLREKILVQRPNESVTSRAFSEDDKGDLVRSWESNNTSTYDSVTGYANGAHIAKELAAKGEPTNLFELAHQEARKRNCSFHDALVVVCDEHNTPLPRLARAVADLLAKEPGLLREEEEAAARLMAARNRLEEARCESVGVLKTRDRLVAQLSELRAVRAELEAKTQSISRRYERAANNVKRFTRRGVVIPWEPLVDAGMIAGALSLALAEMKAQLDANDRQTSAAESELAGYLDKNQEALEPVLTQVPSPTVAATAPGESQALLPPSSRGGQFPTANTAK